MAKSSVWGIPYEIRPSKQVERRLVIETLLLAREVGSDVRRLPFIGMGGVRFIDMLLAHKLASMSEFVSLEQDETLWERCELNKPFSKMDVYRGSAAQYLAEVGLSQPAVVWFDIERMVSKNARDDILALATAAQPGSFVFVTATAEMPGELRSVKGRIGRLAQLKASIGPLADQIPQEWLASNDFHQASAYLAMKFLRYAFNGRLDGSFEPLINLTYRDSSWMATVGGYFGDGMVAASIAANIRSRMPFILGPGHDAPFVLEQFNITDSERILFDRSATDHKRIKKHRKQLETLGFRETIIDQYGDLMRFIPRYVETAL